MIAHPDHSVKTGIVLASASPRRRELITLLGLPVEITSAGIDEVPLPGERAEAMAQRLSREKALTAARQFDRPHSAARILLASDTVVSLDGEPLGKPRDTVEARSMLRRLRGRTHQVYTAIMLLGLQSTSAHCVAPGADAVGNGSSSAPNTITDLASSDVPMRACTDMEIEAYIASGDPFDKAGAYAIQHSGFHPVANFQHCFANVMGLPLCHVVRALRQLDVEPPHDVPALCQTHLCYDCPVFERILLSDE